MIFQWNKEYKKKGLSLRNCLAGTQAAATVARIVPADVHLVVVPVDVRHIAIGVTRTRYFIWLRLNHR